MPRRPREALPATEEAPTRADPEDEARVIREALAGLVRSSWDGALALLELADAGERDLDPAAWPARYFRHVGRRLLHRATGWSDGPTIGGVRFPIRAGHVWDLAVRIDGAAAELGERARFEAAIDAHDGVGVVVASGQASGDAAEFARWLAQFSRDPSRALARGSVLEPLPAFRAREVVTRFFPDRRSLDRSVSEGAIGFTAVAAPVSRASADRPAAAAPVLVRRRASQRGTGRRANPG